MPTEDYIKRSELIEHFKNYNPNWGVIDKDTVLDDIRDFSAADVEPVRHGWWIDENPASPLDPRMRCSVCGRVDLPLAKWRFCPMCGAKMDKEADDV